MDRGKSVRGDRYTPDDIIYLAEVNWVFNQIPRRFRWYYTLKAGYFMKRSRALGVGVALLIILLGILDFAIDGGGVLSIAFIIIGVLVGLLLAWEIDRR